VQLAGFGIFTMEGGAIMDNTAGATGGGISLGSRATFIKTGGIIYGANAPVGYRNTALNGAGTPKNHGHAVWVSILSPTSQYRNDTVGENDTISYAGAARGNGIFGKGEKWDNPDKALMRMLAAIILPVLAVVVCSFLVYRRRTLQKVMKVAQEAAVMPEKVFDNVKLTRRETEVGKLLLTELSMKQIATVMKIAYVTVDYHCKKLYLKMGIDNRMELLTMARG
jgi:DNA-binding CsgD family transcriptional regulator